MVAIVVPALGLAAVAAGVVMAASAGESRSFGWFAYAPLSNTTFSSAGLLYLGPWTKTGIALALIGSLVLAFWSGYRAGTRR
ncbi:hypothetical protein [Arthrobacter terrae]|nr:hypothetical protein [Arthrobacter terrae]